MDVQMPRLLALTVLSVVVLSLAACGGGQGGQQSEGPPESTGEEEPTGSPEEASEETAPGGEDTSTPDAEQASPEGEGFGVTTLQGEEIGLSGGGDEVVALYFMAGW